MVGEEGLEPSRRKLHRILSPARIPVPPLARVVGKACRPKLQKHEEQRTERVTGIEPVCHPWQGCVIAIIPYPHLKIIS